MYIRVGVDHDVRRTGAERESVYVQYRTTRRGSFSVDGRGTWTMKLFETVKGDVPRTTDELWSRDWLNARRRRWVESV